MTLGQHKPNPNPRSDYDAYGTHNLQKDDTSKKLTRSFSLSSWISPESEASSILEETNSYRLQHMPSRDTERQQKTCHVFVIASYNVILLHKSIPIEEYFFFLFSNPKNSPSPEMQVSKIDFGNNCLRSNMEIALSTFTTSGL